MKHNTELGFNLGGAVQLSERVSDPPESDTVEFLAGECDDELRFNLGYSTDPDITDHNGFSLEFSAYHMKNAETGRTFHAAITLYPSRAHVKQIRDFCDLLLAITDK